MRNPENRITGDLVSAGQPVWAVGLMSGTSLDGIDAALLRTDGEAIADLGPSLARSYSDGERRALEGAVAAAAEWTAGPAPAPIAEAARTLTVAHGEIVAALLAEAGFSKADVALVGFHGQTVRHEPQNRRTVQIGDGALLAQLTGLPVAFDFRSADVEAGGEGAPLVPLYHAALVARARHEGRLKGPIAVLNVGGVANVTYVGSDAGLLAFDTGPGNGPIDDWIAAHTGARCDEDGRHARTGQISEILVTLMLDNPFFGAAPPKSLDRADFGVEPIGGLSLADGAATLTAFTAASVAAARAHLPENPETWVVCGGGRRNPVLMAELERRIASPVVPAEAMGWRGDDTEAEAFAFLAARVARGLPLTLPETTGAPRPLPGGRLARP